MFGRTACYRPTVHSALGSFRLEFEEVRHRHIGSIQLQAIVHAHPGKFLANDGAKVGLEFAGTFCISLTDIQCSHLEIHLSRHAVTKVYLDAPIGEAVLFGVNETRGNDVTLRVDGFLSADLVFGDRNDPALTNPNVRDLIESSFWIHDAPIKDCHVIILSSQFARRQEDAQSNEGSSELFHFLILSPVVIYGGQSPKSTLLTAIGRGQVYSNVMPTQCNPEGIETGPQDLTGLLDQLPNSFEGLSALTGDLPETP